MFFKNKIVWITGASSGIGEALVYEFAKQKAIIVISSNQEKELLRVKENVFKTGAECFIQYLDVTDIEKISKTASEIINQFGRIDVLINNAGISQRSLVVDTQLEIDRKIMEINYFGSIAITKAVLPQMIKQKYGYIAVTSSISGKFGFPLRSAYSAAKHALHGFYETLRAEVYQHNIKVLIAFPGRVQTNISLHALTKDGTAHGKMDDGQALGISAEKCAIQYLRAIEKDKKEVLIGSSELLMVYIHKFLPKLFYKLARKIKPT
ncbi:MAG: short-chain dehydrogenase [Bacteroidetes bacterium GWC2_33_15]|nr:MAG: short-chain dehydrogenase [Bacteroidetes bacterium GWA2_33_15]OFX52233.1 MAG: short-chain dehydrogenase [Bacteroidetes bacterium GWC2_33_15]OFX64387.1 MAG: short-chain dehydrogenase [Bacteroidetes bacterium GWB2_32_14]OFX67792.1 MAG: short-chain dehydrogenase [Bacteroidetes bacterium GWD2_33_33]HAN19404.1 short chain dehydrogenase [Bacteroidales bacterium]